jgi:hypothetical protein
LQLSKKLARWVTKMLYEETKKERLRSCQAVMGTIAHCGFFTVLDNFLTVSELAGGELAASSSFRRPPRRGRRGCEKWHGIKLSQGTPVIILAL